MTLRGKLLLLALSVLVLPWAGWQFVRQMETLLREGQAQALQASAEALARGLAAQPAALPPARPGLFVQTLARAPRLDADDADWQREDGTPATADTRRFGGAPDAPALRLTAARADDVLYLFVQARAQGLVRADAHWPGAGGRDHLRLALAGPHGALALRVANADDGPARVATLEGDAAPVRIEGAWRWRDDGFDLELRIPQGYPVDGLGATLVRHAGGRRHEDGTDAEAPGAWPLLAPDAALAAPLRQLVPPGARARFVDRDGWVLAAAGDLAGPASEAVPPWRRWIHGWLRLDAAEAEPADPEGAVRTRAPEVWQALDGRPGVAWRREPYGARVRLSAAVPVALADGLRGAVVLEREDAEGLLLTDRALTGLLGTSLVALLAAGLVLFLFAGRLSGRIRRLRDAAERALDRDGRVQRFPQTRARDEIGDLSRSFARLLDEVAAYTDYLRTLAGKLSHELNTPLAIVRTSLDNLDPVDLPDDARPYLERARGGVDRLGAIVRGMSEVVRLEHAIDNADAEDLDLAALVRDCAEGYRALLAPRALQVAVQAGPMPFHGAPDLLAQALDKLVDNARGFAPPDGWVRIGLARAEGGEAVLTVANAGPPLPAAMRDKLFDSLVSVRDRTQRADGGAHLGLGLTIVRLVAELHEGRAEARDLPDAAGVEFRLVLRGIPRR
ncbi:ATP-binding protein [Coralloluteibacterium thermophilus]|uniref:histidine kinase n=1 Tax=Coralloluteibacterium thermophilum TaxID=2707049 RepID=A0ABV9NFK2_9GAMM